MGFRKEPTLIFLKKINMKPIIVLKSNYLFFLALFLFSTPAVTYSQNKPNIIFFLVDDLGWSDISSNGSKYYETPNIDKLTKNGLKFSHAYASSALCSPTRASILTGKNPARLHITHAIPILGYKRIEDGHATPLKDANYVMNLPLEEVTIAEALKSAGYATASIGKWHVSEEKDFFPQAQGFDINIGGDGHGATSNYFYPYKNKWRMATEFPYQEWNTLPDGKEGEYLTNRLTEESLKFIDQNKGKPFFLYLSHYAVHAPIQAIKSIEEKYINKPADQIRGHNNAGYAAMLESVDNSMGALVAELEKLGIADNTIIIFASDNGGFGKVTSNYPFRGNKGNFYEGGIRVPLIINWPGVTKQAETDVPVISSDFYPTILQMAGLRLMPDQHKDGLSLIPVLKSEGKLKRENLFWHFPNYVDFGHPNPSKPLSVIRNERYKLIESLEDGSLELYDLKEDIKEEKNLIKEKPQVAARLQKKLAVWRKSANVQMPEVNPDYQKK